MNRQKILFSLLFFFLLFFLSTNLSFSSERDVMQAKLIITPELRVKDIHKMQLDIIKLEPRKYIEFITNREQVEDLQRMGYEIEIVHHDLVLYYRSQLDTSKDMGGYHTYEETGHFLDSMHNEYPDITTDTFSIGQSLEDRSIWGFKISDNPEVDEDEPEIFYNGLHHAREPMSIEVLIYYITHLLENYGTDPEVTDIVDNAELWFVPIINPDGYEYNRQEDPGGGGMWRKNRRDNGDGTWGVDPNRNYGYMWGYDDEGSSPNTGSETYRGTGPFSEPEIQVIRDFISAHDFVVCINYHSVAELFLMPWGFDYIRPTDYLVDDFMGDSAEYFTGYDAIPGHVFYLTNGDSDDWLRGETTTKNKVFGYTPELGMMSFWPPAWTIPVVCQDNLEANMFYARTAQDLNDRSIRHIETDPNYTPFISSIGQYSDSVYNFRIYNHDPSSPLDFNITDPDSTGEMSYDMASLNEFLYSKGYLYSFDPFELFAKTSFSSSRMYDWLRVSPTTGSIPAGSYQDLAVTVDANGIEGEYFGKDYFGTIVIATNNDRIPPYSDTTLIDVNMKVFTQYFDQYTEIKSSRLYAGISNNTNVGRKDNPGLGYLDDEIGYLYDGSLFLGYIPQPGDTVVHRQMLNTSSLRATSHLVIDSTTDPNAVFVYYSDSTEDGDLGIDGEIAVYQIPDSSEFLIFKYRIFNLSGTITQEWTRI